MIKKIINTLGTKVLTALINFLIVVAISQYLGADGKGEQGIIIATIALILLFSNVIGGASLVYLAPRYRASQLILPAYIWSVITGLLWFGILWFLRIVPQEWAPHLALLATINSWASVNTNLLIGREQIGKSNLINLCQSLCVIIIFPAMVVWGGMQNIRAYMIALYVSYLVMFLLSLIFALPGIRDHSTQAAAPYRKIIRDLFVYGFMNQLAHIAQLLSFRLSYYLLEAYAGLKTVGVYSNGASLMEAVWMISGSIALVQYSKIANTEDRTWSQQFTARLTRYSLWSSIAAIIPLVLLPADFWVWLFGPGFSEVNLTLWWLAPGVLLFNYAMVPGHYFSGTGRYFVNALGSAAGLVITVALALWLIPVYGFQGAAFTASISYMVTSVMVLIWFLKESQLPFRLMLPLFSDIREMWKIGTDLLVSLKNINKHGKNQ